MTDLATTMVFAFAAALGVILAVAAAVALWQWLEDCHIEARRCPCKRCLERYGPINRRGRYPDGPPMPPSGIQQIWQPPKE